MAADVRLVQNTIYGVKRAAKSNSPAMLAYSLAAESQGASAPGWIAAFD